MTLYSDHHATFFPHSLFDKNEIGNWTLPGAVHWPTSLIPRPMISWDIGASDEVRVKPIYFWGGTVLENGIQQMVIELDEGSTSKYFFADFSMELRGYLAEEFDIPDLVKSLKSLSTAQEVIRMLDGFGLNRKLSQHDVSTEDEQSILKRLADVRSLGQLDSHTDESWIRRLVSALQRISSIHVSPDDFNE